MVKKIIMARGLDEDGKMTAVLTQAGYQVIKVAQSNYINLLQRESAPLVLIYEVQETDQSEYELDWLKSVVSIPVIAIGPDKESVLVRTLIAGADAYLAHPSEPTTLLYCLTALLRRESWQRDRN